jgi:chromosome segregation ATPase
MSDSLMVETLRKGMARVMQERDGLKTAYLAARDEREDLANKLNEANTRVRNLESSKAGIELANMTLQDEKMALQEKVQELAAELALQHSATEPGLLTVDEAAALENRVSNLLELIGAIEDCRKMSQARDLINSFFERTNADNNS